MSEVWKTAIFWFAFSLISSWVLRRYYFTKDRVLRERLRVTAFIIEATTVGLFFFPWLPEAQGGFSGWQMIVRGNVGTITLFCLVSVSMILFFTKNPKLLKTGAVLHITAAVLIFAVMMQALPGTVQLGLRDIAPIIAALLLLVNTLIVLLLWHQLQRRDTRKMV